MNQAFPAAKKHVYVPAVRRKKVEQRPTVPLELARIPASAVMRSVCWTGRPAPAPPPAVSLSAPIQPTMTARSAFAEMPWSGERASPPTAGQSTTSVRNVLDRFRWE